MAIVIDHERFRSRMSTRNLFAVSLMEEPDEFEMEGDEEVAGSGGR